MTPRHAWFRRLMCRFAGHIWAADPLAVYGRCRWCGSAATRPLSPTARRAYPDTFDRPAVDQDPRG